MMWWNRLMCRFGRHQYERKGSWSRCIRRHHRRGNDYLCYAHEPPAERRAARRER